MKMWVISNFGKNEKLYCGDENVLVKGSNDSYLGLIHDGTPEKDLRPNGILGENVTEPEN